MDRVSVRAADGELYLRGVATLLASWEEYARGAAGASVTRLPGVAAAVFPEGPERVFFNNALLDRDLDAAGRAEALDAMEAAYRTADVPRFAAWAHEGDVALCADLERRGYSLDESTRAMGMSLDDIRLPRPEPELGPADWSEYLRILGVPPGLSAASARRRSTSWWRASAGRTSPRRWRSTATGTAGSTTSPRWSTPGGADSAPR